MPRFASRPEALHHSGTCRLEKLKGAARLPAREGQTTPARPGGEPRCPSPTAALTGEVQAMPTNGRVTFKNFSVTNISYHHVLVVFANMLATDATEAATDAAEAADAAEVAATTTDATPTPRSSIAAATDIVIASAAARACFDSSIGGAQ